MIQDGDDFGKVFFRDVIKHVAAMKVPNGVPVDDSSYVSTSRDTFHGTREDVSTESGMTVSDETSLLMEARPSPVDMGKQKEVANVLIKFLQVLKETYSGAWLSISDSYHFHSFMYIQCTYKGWSTDTVGRRLSLVQCNFAHYI